LKSKNLLCLAIMASLIATMIPFAYASPTTYYFDPALIVGPPPGIGETFTVTIRVDEVPDLFMWVMDISWDPAIFDLVDYVEGNAIKASGSTIFTVGSITDGFIDDLTCGSLFGAEVSVPPNPTDLVSLTFEVEAITLGTYIDIPWAIWLNIGGLENTPDVGRFYYELPPPPPTPPKAKFTPETCVMFEVGETITLDATTSTAGYDTLPAPGHSCPITEYKWEIDLDCDGMIDLTLYGEYIEDAFTCEAPGDVWITLTVTAPDTEPDTHPDYVETDSETHTIHQVPVVLGPVIDVFTQRGGEGTGFDPVTGEPWPHPTGWSDAFAPQEEVIVFAKVTYNDDPVQNKPVAFEVKDETGGAVVYRVAFTNSEGIANITFRLIWECDKTFADNYEVWTIYASVSVSEEKVDDICKFRYGWLVQIEGIDVVPGTVHKCEWVTITVYLKNIAIKDITVFLTVVLYDDCGVPIGLDTVADLTVPGEVLYWDPELTIHIPKWAFLGTGTIYVNVFTAPPQECGLPMCPEGTAIVILAKP